MWEGVRFLYKDNRLRVLITMVACLSLLQGMEFGVLVLLATTKWGVSEWAYGFFLAAGAAGSLIGSILSDGQVRRFGSGRTLIGAAIVSGLGYLGMAAGEQLDRWPPRRTSWWGRRRNGSRRRQLIPPAR